MTWKHDDLQTDLAASRRGGGEVVVERVGLGSYQGDAILDVATMKLSWTAPNPTAYEVKISRADFFSDTQSGKFEKYLPYLRRLYFAVPSGLVTKAEVPVVAGLIVRGDNGWRVVKAPRVLKPDPKLWPVFLQALLMKHYPGPWASDNKSRADRISAAERAEWTDMRLRGLAVSDRVRRLIADADEMKWRTESERRSLAVMAGVEADGRRISDLVHMVLDKRPFRDPPDAYRLRGIAEDLTRLADRVGEIAKKQDVSQPEETHA